MANNQTLETITAIVLAAGRGSRLKATNNKNKVVYQLSQKPMISYTIDNLQKTGINNILVVVGYAKESVKAVLNDRVSYVEQKERLGTGHAVKIALPAVSSSSSTIMVMYGDDSAFYPKELFKTMIKNHHQHHAAVTLLTLELDNPKGLGRIIRRNNNVVGIIEEKNATGQEKLIKEINTGLYCFDSKFIINNINQIKKNPVSGEYYLTDIIEIATMSSKTVQAVKWPDSKVWCGVNTTKQLQNAKDRMRSLNQ